MSRHDKKLNDSQAVEALALRSEGWTWVALAARYGVSQKGIINRCQMFLRRVEELPHSVAFAELKERALAEATKELGTKADRREVEGRAAEILFTY